MGNRSLDDFLDAGSDGGDASDDDGTTVEDRADPVSASGASADASTEPANESVEGATEVPESAAEPAGPDDESVEPAVSTYVWDGAGGECTACGETVAERWQSEAGPVCRACKDW
jgi:hypothetical protein